MSLEPVDIFVKDSTLAANPIQGVVARVYDQAGAVFFTQGVTNSSGLTQLMLNSGATYQLRFYKQHVAFPNALLVTVLPSPALNAFDVTGSSVEPPTVADLRLCVAFGYFRNPDGSPARNINLRFVTKFKPLLLEGDGVLTPSLDAKTDDHGYMQITLIRYGQYDVVVEGVEDHQRLICIPNQANVNLPSLLFPIVDRIEFAPPGPWTVAAGQELVVTPTIIASDGNPVVPGEGDVLWSSSNNEVLAVLPAGGLLTLRGLIAGTANVQAVRADQTIVRIPDPGITGVPLAVTVT